MDVPGNMPKVLELQCGGHQTSNAKQQGLQQNPLITAGKYAFQGYFHGEWEDMLSSEPYLLCSESHFVDPF